MSGAPGPGRVIDTANWMILCEMICAAHDGNILRFSAAGRRLDNEVPVDGKAGSYVAYLLWKWTVDQLGRRATSEDFRKLAVRAHEKIVKMAKLNVEELEDTVRTVFSQVDESRQVTGEKLIVNGALILGALFDDPSVQLDTLYPSLADWYQRTFPQ